jgi:hypothetical protein
MCDAPTCNAATGAAVGAVEVTALPVGAAVAAVDVAVVVGAAVGAADVAVVVGAAAAAVGVTVVSSCFWSRERARAWPHV